MGANSPLEAAFSNAGQREGYTVYQAPLVNDSLWNRIRSPYRMGDLSTQSFLTDTSLDILQGAQGDTKTGQELMDELPYLTLDPDKSYGANQIERLRLRNQREEMIQFEALTLAQPTNIFETGLQFTSGLAGSLWGSTVGDPAGLALNAGVAVATEGAGSAFAATKLGAQVISKMPAFVGRLATLQGRTGAAIRQTASGVVENTLALPAYSYATTSQGVEYDLKTDGLLDVGVGSAVQGAFGFLFPGKARINEAVPHIREHRTKVNADAEVINGFESADKTAAPTNPVPTGEPLDIDIPVEFETPLVDTPSNAEVEIKTIDKPLNTASEPMNQVLMSNDPEEIVNSISNLLDQSFMNMLDQRLTEGLPLTAAESQLRLMQAQEAKTVFEVFTSLVDQYPQLKQIVEITDTALASKAVRDAISGANRALKEGDILRARDVLQKTLTTLNKSAGATTKKKSSASHLERIPQLEAEVEALRAEAIEKGYGDSGELGKKLEEYEPYKKKSATLRQTKSKYNKALRAEGEGADATSLSRQLIENNLEELNKLIGDEPAPTPEGFNVAEAAQQLDALGIDSRLANIMSANTLMDVLGREGINAKINSIKGALLQGVKRRLGEYEKFLDIHETMVKEALQPEMPDNLKTKRAELDKLTAGYKDADSFIKGRADELKTQIDQLQKLELDPKESALMDANTQKAKAILEKAEDFNQDLMRQALCFLGE